LLHLRELSGICRVRRLEVSGKQKDGKILKAMVKTNVGNSQGRRTRRPIAMRHGDTCLCHNDLTMTVISIGRRAKIIEGHNARSSDPIVPLLMMVILAISFANLRFSGHLDVSI